MAEIVKIVLDYVKRIFECLEDHVFECYEECENREICKFLMSAYDRGYWFGYDSGYEAGYEDGHRDG